MFSRFSRLGRQSQRTMSGTKYLVIGIVLQAIYISAADGVRCFECQNYPSPSLCSDVTTCTKDDYCYVEEYVTTSGRVVYNSGCMTKSRCASSGSLFGRRQTDLLVCSECCQGELCNNAGCNKQAIPRDQRGPYCYSCDFMTDPAGCDKVTICPKDQQCSLYIPKEFHLYPTLLYSAGCQTNNTCDTLAVTSNHAVCPPTCCTGDFCNTKCGAPITVPSTLSTSTITTHSTTPPTTPSTTPSTTPPTTPTTTSTSTAASTTVTTTTSTTTTPPTAAPTTSRPQCGAVGSFYTVVPVPNTNGLCIRVGHIEHNWMSARTTCNNQNADLLVLDTEEKIHAIKEYMHNHHEIHGEKFWIGAYKVNDHMTWVDGQQVGHWDGGDHHGPGHGPGPPGHDGNCILMNRHEDFHWNGVNCDEDHVRFICERK